LPGTIEHQPKLVTKITKFTKISPRYDTGYESCLASPVSTYTPLRLLFQFVLFAIFVTRYDLVIGPLGVPQKKKRASARSIISIVENREIQSVFYASLAGAGEDGGSAFFSQLSDLPSVCLDVL
jgi:hypothetical protein